MTRAVGPSAIESGFDRGIPCSRIRRMTRRMAGLLAALVVAIAAWTPAFAAMYRDEDTVAVTDASRDIVSVDWARMGLHAGCVLRFSAEPALEHVRLLLDVDGPDRGAAPSGADFMVEGGRFYRHTGDDQGWTWDAVGEAAVVEDGRALRLLLPVFPHGTAFRWSAETLDAGLAAVDRIPPSGMADTRWDILEEGVRTEAAPADLTELARHAPLTLSYRFDTELKAVLWKPSRDPLPMTWRPASITSAIPFALTIEEAGGGVVATGTAGFCSAVSNSVRWDGVANGVEWTLLSEMKGDDLQLTGQLKSDRPQRLRLKVSLAIPAELWTEVPAEDEVERLLGARDGGGLPLGVTRGDAGLVWVEQDVREPRRCRVTASDAERTLSLIYDLGLTAATSNFPGRAAFRFHAHYLPWMEDVSARDALAAFYALRPDASRRRMIRAGAWSLESGDAREFTAASLKPGEVDGLLLETLSPWSHGQAIPEGFACDEETALRLVRWASLGGGRQADLALSALSSVRRDGEGGPATRLSADPACMAGWDVAVDPDLAPVADFPVTRAMAWWRQIDGALGKTAGGVWLWSGWAWGGLNHDAAALGVADYPCVFEQDDPLPGLAGEISAMEFLAPLVEAIHARGGYVAAEVSPAGESLPAACYDLLVGRRVSGAELPDTRWRVLAAKKPLVIPVDTDGCSPGDVASALSSLLYWGCMPVLESRPDQSVQGILAVYLPVMQRVAEAGWEPRRLVSLEGGPVTTEGFGDGPVRYVTFRNSTDEWVTVSASFRPVPEHIFLVDPFSADLLLVEPGTTSLAVRVREGVSVRDWVPVSAAGGEIEFHEGRPAAGGEGRAVARSLESASAEVKRGWACGLAFPAPAVRGETNSAVLTVSNHGQRPVKFSGLKVISSRQFIPFDDATAEIGPGETAEFAATFREEDLGETSWLEVQWNLEDEGGAAACSRMIRPEFVEPVVFYLGSTNVVSAELDGELVLEARSHSTRAREVKVAWEGDFKEGEKELLLPPGGRARITVPVRAARRRGGQVLVRARVEGELFLEELFNVALGYEEGR